MTEIQNPRAPTRQPTLLPALNTVLANLVERVAGLLGDNFVGAYLQGSLAIGDFDDQSDVDLMIVVAEDIAEADLPALQDLHAKLFAELAAPWGQKVELSYFPATVLKRWSATPRDPPDAEPRPTSWVDPGTGLSPPRAYPLLYLDIGAKSLVRSEHDNTRVVRWTARERGIVLAGPDPRELIDVVTPIALRAEVRGSMQGLAAKCLADPSMMKQRWTQAFFVTLFCRMLHTLSTGEITSKRAASAWALEAFALRWRALIQRAMAARAEPLEMRLSPSSRADVDETLAFIRQVLRQDAPKKPKPKRRGPKPGFTFNAMAPGHAKPDAPPPKRAPGKRPFAKAGGSAAPGRSFSKDPAAKRAPGRDGAPRSSYSRDAAPRDGESRGPAAAGAPAKRPYSKGPPSRGAGPKGGPPRGSFSKGPPRGGPSRRPPGGRPPPKK